MSDDRQMAMIVYLLYLGSHAFPILAIVGVILAYVARDSAPDWLKTHYTFQIRTFWIGLLYWFVSVLTVIVIVGLLGLLATLVWSILRSVLGLSRLVNGEPYPNPYSWIT
jgi:uncharacterized membrane protein